MARLYIATEEYEDTFLKEYENFNLYLRTFRNGNCYKITKSKLKERIDSQNNECIKRGRKCGGYSW